MKKDNVLAYVLVLTGLTAIFILIGVYALIVMTYNVLRNL